MKYLFLLTLIFSLSCSKNTNSLGESLSNFEEPKEETSTTKVDSIPMIKLGKLADMNLHIFDNEKEHSYALDVKFKKGNYIRSKMERILYKSSSDRFDLRDLLKVELEVDSKNKVKLFKNHRFSDLKKYEVRAKANFTFNSSSKAGVIEDISYKFSFLDPGTGLESDRSYFDLFRYENQNEEIDLSENNKTYSLESGVYSYSVLVNKLISGNKFIYEVVDYSYEDLVLNKWLDSKRESSFLFISSVDMSYFIEVYEGETIFEAIKRKDKSNEISDNGNIRKLNQIKGDWIKVNFSNVHRTLKEGEILGIYLKEMSLNNFENSKRISEKLNIENTNVTQFKNKTIDFYIQLESERTYIQDNIKTHKIIRAIGSSCDANGENCLSINHDSPAIKYCRANSPILVTEAKKNISTEIEKKILIDINGKSHTLSELLEQKLGTVFIDKGIIHISIYPFDSISDYRDISIKSRNKLESSTIRSRKIDCPTLIGLNSRRPDGRYNFMWDYLEGFEIFEEDLHVGERYFLDLIIVN